MDADIWDTTFVCPDECDLPVRRAVGLRLAEFCRRAQRPLVVNALHKASPRDISSGR